jgi:hypothetical protein
MNRNRRYNRPVQPNVGPKVMILVANNPRFPGEAGKSTVPQGQVDRMVQWYQAAGWQHISFVELYYCNSLMAYVSVPRD